MTTGLITLLTTSLLLTIAPMSIGSNNVEIISDFVGNEFVLIEGDNYYEIQDSNGNFIEGSLKNNSPYYELAGDKFYLGPSNYFVEQNDVVTDIFTGAVSSIEEYSGFVYVLNPLLQTRASEPVPDSSTTYTDAYGYTVVNKADYFRKLKYFPQNWFGECGTTALSMLLSYYDTFYNDDFIPNNTYYDARYYVKESTLTRSSDEDKWVFDHTTSEPLAKTVTTTYKDIESYDFKDWQNMPGTAYAMRDYLFDKYMHTFMGIGWDSAGYPMLNVELNDTLLDYMEDNCSDLIEDTEYRHGSLLYTHQRPKEYIAEGLPTLLVLQSYDSTISNGKSHVVVAYGYKDDKFLAHFGWWPGDTKSAEVIINSSTIYGYFTIKYTGSHKHSYNVSMTNGNVTKYICGCGDVHTSEYSISPADWNFDERYYFENEEIKTSTISIEDLSFNTDRLRCGYIEEEYINLSPNRIGAGDAYLTLEFDEPIYKLSTNLSWWSASENMYSLNGDYAYIQYLDANNNWINAVDLLAIGLPTDRTNQMNIEYDFLDGTYRIRYLAHKETPNTSRNKGRISIGDTIFVTK